MIQNKYTIISGIKSMKNQLTRRFHGEVIGIFGSYARDEATQKSDLDILVRFNENATLIDLVGMSQYLESKLKCNVDILSDKAMKKEFEPYIKNDLIAI
ncbi:MAG: nucleotidyltransferase domain-containing protein [Candidatus Marinimicrobia bacterium]|nr:nucleotidyltransferase domain-containing protein [Candidatus Neomarinimicrobiota bacterium]MBL7010430.1 nucleotidyltransferase domain-containing protein [Candidatus Neomarinimicrobiota bacterium]MBL7030074.1 nucleotidyltransferase domain-containing protein [Candidatus Neomarinimicrobiota bacterium]